MYLTSDLHFLRYNSIYLAIRIPRLTLQKRSRRFSPALARTSHASARHLLRLLLDDFTHTSTCTFLKISPHVCAHYLTEIPMGQFHLVQVQTDNFYLFVCNRGKQLCITAGSTLIFLISAIKGVEFLSDFSLNLFWMTDHLIHIKILFSER